MKINLSPFSKKIIRVIILTLIVVILSLFLFSFASLFAPLIVAFIISSMLEPIVKFLNKKCKIKRHYATLITLISFLSTIGFLIFVGISKLFNEIASISTKLPLYSKLFVLWVSDWVSKGEKLYIRLPKEVTSYAESILANIGSSLLIFAESVAKGILNTATSLPETLIFLLVVIMSTYFISSDQEDIIKFLNNHIPEKWLKIISKLKDDIFVAFLGYVKAQLIIMTITFFFLLIGFSIIGLEYSLLLAFLICLIDALPVLGVGTVLIPWSVYLFISQDVRGATTMIILYVVILVVRQILEPKILSKQIGVHPLAAITAMYIGLKLFGIVGMILSPIFALLSKNIISGLLKNFNIKTFLENLSIKKT